MLGIDTADARFRGPCIACVRAHLATRSHQDLERQVVDGAASVLTNSKIGFHGLIDYVWLAPELLAGVRRRLRPLAPVDLGAGSSHVARDAREFATHGYGTRVSAYIRMTSCVGIRIRLHG